MRQTIKDPRDKNRKNNATSIKWQFLGKTIEVWQGNIKLIQIGKRKIKLI